MPYADLPYVVFTTMYGLSIPGNKKMPADRKNQVLLINSEPQDVKLTVEVNDTSVEVWVPKVVVRDEQTNELYHVVFLSRYVLEPELTAEQREEILHQATLHPNSYDAISRR